MTLKDLLKDIKKLVEKDKTILDKEIYLSDDEEGNGYHGCYFSLVTNPKDIKECIEFSNGCREGVVDPNKIIILG